MWKQAFKDTEGQSGVSRVNQGISWRSRARRWVFGSLARSFEGQASKVKGQGKSIALTALWSLGGLIALLAAGICGGVVALFTRNRLSIFTGVTAMAFGVALTFLAVIVIYLAEVVS